MMRGKKKIIIVLSAILCVVTTIVYALLSVKKSKDLSGLSAEMLMEMKYDQVTDEDTKVEDCSGIKFSAFFTRDLDNDGKAEKIKGTCKEIGQNDTLYVELNVLTQGYLKNGKITLNAKNFTWTTAIVSDNVVKGDYIGKTTEIQLQDQLNAGTQKTFWGTIDADLKNNKGNYSQVSSVTLSGTYVTGQTDGTTTEKTFSKTVNLDVDWYGKTATEVNKYYYNGTGYESYKNQKYDIDTLVDGDNVKVNFQVAVAEVSRQLILEKQELEITIPELNGYQATSARSTDDNVEYEYKNGKLTITRKAEVGGDGTIKSSIARSNLNNIEIIYPLEAYTNTSSNSISLEVPVKGYNYGFNNTNNGFNHPYVSEAEGKVTITYSKSSEGEWNVYTYVGNRIYNNASKTYKYEVSKEPPTDIYNGNIYEDETDQYPVEWQVITGEKENLISTITLEEAEQNKEDGSDKFYKRPNTHESMKDYIKTTGIYFSNASGFLGDDGWIKLYNTNGDTLIQTFTSKDWSNYSKESPFKVDLKSIKIETSKPQSDQAFSVYQIKEIDDKALTSVYDEENFKSLSHIYTYLKGTATLIKGATSEDSVDGAGLDEGANTNKVTSELYASNSANYDMPYSVPQLSVLPDKITNQKTEDVTFKILAYSTNILEKKWVNGVFLLELPDKLLNVTVKNVKSSEEGVKIKSHSTYEKDGKYYIKIFTENNEEATFNIEVETSITANPLETTQTKDVNLYAYNENCDNYINCVDDKFDVDIDGKTEDKIGMATATMEIIAPSGLLTTEYVTDYNDNKESMTIAPNVADIEKSNGNRTAKINVSLTNNYEGTISDVVILGKIPYSGNKYTLTEGELHSNYTANLKGLITVPEELAEDVKVYYSSNPNATTDLNVTDNGWESDINNINLENVKAYLICLNNHTLKQREKDIFTYEVEIPVDESDYNSISFSHHAVYYNLDTNEGKLPVQTEPNKVGIQIVSKFNLELTKTKTAHENIVVPGATYTVTTEDVDGNKITRSATTNEEGVLELDGLYIGKKYTLKEISSTDDYVVSDKEIEFTTKIGEDGNLTCEVIKDGFKGAPQALIDENENYTVKANVEDEAKYTLIINKKNSDNQPLSKVRFSLKGRGINTSVKTDEEGNLIVTGLYPNELYELQETRADGYYIDEKPRKFILKRDGDGNLKVYQYDEKDVEKRETEDDVLKNAVIVDDGGQIQPIVTLNITNEKIPTYNLQIVKVEENKKAEELDDYEKLKDATFIVKTKDSNEQKEYTTDEEGKITINGLYARVEGKYIDGEYIIQETKAPDGYSNNGEEIHLIVTKCGDTLEAKVNDEEQLQSFKKVKVEGNVVTLVIQDKPLFKLTKIDSDTGKTLANVKFIIYELDGEGHEIGYAKDANGNPVGELDELGQYIVTTGEDGTLSLPLRPGTYKAVEVGYPDGYQEKPNEQFFKIADKNDKEVEGEKIDPNKVIHICTIEDLVELADDVNKGNSLTGYTVILEKDLDFLDDSSYETKDLNALKKLKMELTTGEGFTPIGKDDSNYFSGTFDGRGSEDGKLHEIRNLYINTTANRAGLFGRIEDGEVKNLGVTGSVTSTCSVYAYTGGIVGYISGNINNCYNMADVTAIGETGGIAGVSSYKCSINDSYNTGNITSRYYAAGIVSTYSRKHG